MIARCHRGQWPTEYGGELVPGPAPRELDFLIPPRRGDTPKDTPHISTWCEACGCNHADGMILP
jgi:hypothetical protein